MGISIDPIVLGYIYEPELEMLEILAEDYVVNSVRRVKACVRRVRRVIATATALLSTRYSYKTLFGQKTNSHWLFVDVAREA